jgi:hypothetical protein
MMHFKGLVFHPSLKSAKLVLAETAKAVDSISVQAPGSSGFTKKKILKFSLACTVASPRSVVRTLLAKRKTTQFSNCTRAWLLMLMHPRVRE